MGKEEKYAVILAGGGGTRLWPLSRKNKPKQFLKIIDSKTLLQETFARIRKAFPPDNIYVVTSEYFAAEVRREIGQLPAENILIEPVSKNTTAAIGLAATHVAKKNPEAVFSSFAADHYIAAEDKFLKALAISQEAARRGNNIVTIGIRPTHAHTGYGYIRIADEKLRIGAVPVFKIREFKEKPDASTAAAYVSSGKYFWNANINSYKVSTLLAAIEKFSPFLHQALELSAADKSKNSFVASWRKLPPAPIDTAILEKAGNVYMVRGDFSWVDVGDWDCVYSILSKNSENITLGTAGENISIESRGNLIISDVELVVTMGVNDLVVVKSGAVLLICPRSQSQRVRKVVEKLARENRDKFL